MPAALGLLESDALARVGAGAWNAIDRRKIWVIGYGFWIVGCGGCEASPGSGLRYQPGRTLSDGYRSIRSRYGEDGDRWDRRNRGDESTDKNWSPRWKVKGNLGHTCSEFANFAPAG